MAKRHLWQPLRGRGPDSAQYLFQTSVPGPDGDFCFGGLQTGPDRNLRQADGAQRRDPGYDPASPRLPSHHRFPSGLQGLRVDSLRTAGDGAHYQTPDLVPAWDHCYHLNHEQTLCSPPGTSSMSCSPIQRRNAVISKRLVP